MSWGNLLRGSGGGLIMGAYGGLLHSDAISPGTRGVRARYSQYTLADDDEAEWLSEQAAWYGEILGLDPLCQDVATQNECPRLQFVKNIAYYDGGFVGFCARFDITPGLRGSLTKMQPRIVGRCQKFADSEYDPDSPTDNSAGLVLKANVFDERDHYDTMQDWIDDPADGSISFDDLNAAYPADGMFMLSEDCVDRVNAFTTNTFYLHLLITRASPFPYPGLYDYSGYDARCNGLGMKIGLAIT